jgi:hypothetical protein
VLSNWLEKNRDIQSRVLLQRKQENIQMRN